jgi:CHAT domain-containing protein/Tfp pilus assembly protein PilF
MKSVAHMHLQGVIASLALLLLLAAAAGAVPTGPGGSTPPQTTATPPAALPPGEVIKKRFTGGEPHTLGVALAAGQYAQVTFLWRGTDLEASVFRPDGSRLSESPVQLRAPGPASVSVLADATGEYRLEVRPGQGLKINGEYEVWLRAVRQPTRADESRLSAERALAEARRPGTKTAEAKLKEALQHWRDAEDPEGEAAALQALAELYRNVGSLDEARKTFEAAATVRRQLKDSVGEAHTLLYLGAAYRDLSSPAEALPFYEQALGLFRGAGNRTGESMSLYSAGFALARAGRVLKAVPYYEDALRIQTADGDRLREVSTLTALGGAYDRLGDYDKALALYLKAAPLRLELGDRVGEALTVNNIGVLHDNWGDWQKARESYEAALSAYGSLLENGLAACVTDTSESAVRICGLAASALDNLGELYNSLGDPQTALATFEKSLVIRDKLGRPKGQGSTRARMCYSNLLQGKPREALRLCEGVEGQKGALSFQKPADARKPSVDPPGLATTYLLLGMAHDALDERERALAYYARAIEIHNQIDDPRSLAITLDKAGATYARAGDTANAFDRFDRALRIWQRIKDRDGEAITLYKIARGERDRGNLTEAHARITRALEVVESLRVNVTSQRLRASYFAQKLDYYELAVDLKMQLAKAGGRGVAPPEELVAAAFLTSERSRARVLFEMLAESRAEPGDGPDQTLNGLLRRRRELQQRLNYKASVQTRLLANKTPAEELVLVEKEVSQLAAEYDDVEAQIRLRSPRFAELARPQPLSDTVIRQQLLDDDTLLLAYSLGDVRSYLWVVAPSGIKSFELRKRAEIEEAARRVADILRDEQRRPNELAQPYQVRLAGLEGQFREEAARLSHMLLGPAASELGRKRLLVVAEGSLQLVPFAALPAPEAAGGDGVRLLKAASLSAPSAPPPLGAEHEIVNLPSASTLAAIRDTVRRRQSPPKAVAVLADPVFDPDDFRFRPSVKSRPRPESLSDAERSFGAVLPRLPASRKEGLDILATVPSNMSTSAFDFEASRTMVEGERLSQYRIIHIATHGLFNDTQPELSGVVLSLFDARGRPREDGFLRLHDIYNLHLPVDMVVLSACQTGEGKQVRGEGLIGLTRGFMYAGAARVVASLWKVDDEATAALMKVFYQRMLRDGMPPPAALREAQMSVRAQRRWAAPYYWAGFVIQGEWK